MFSDYQRPSQARAVSTYLKIIAASLVAIGIVLVVLIPSDPGDDGLSFGDQASNDSQRILAPRFDENGYSNLFNQFFQFNPDTRRVGLAFLSGTIQGQYQNTIIDSAGLGDVRIFVLGPLLLTPTQRKCASIALCFGKHPRLAVSPNFIVSSPGSGTSWWSPGYCAVVVFEDNGVVNGTLKFSRNAVGSTTFDLGAQGAARTAVGSPFPTGRAVEFAHLNRRKDSVQWTVEREGRLTHRGTLAFPVVGKERGLVYYYVALADGSLR